MQFLGHPRFFNQLSTGLDIVSMAGEWLTATANTNMFTYEIAPVFILMENECLAKMRNIIGFQTGDSILAPGGSINNMYALMIARHKIFPQHKKHGMRAIKGQLIMYTSRHVSEIILILLVLLLLSHDESSLIFAFCPTIRMRFAQK